MRSGMGIAEQLFVCFFAGEANMPDCEVADAVRAAHGWGERHPATSTLLLVLLGLTALVLAGE